MRRSRVWMLPVFLVMAAPAVWAATGDLRTGPETLRGGYLVTFNIRLGTALPAGEAILCRAHVAPRLGGQAAETATGLAVVSGSTANCTVRLPVRWAVNGAALGDEAALSYEIDAVSGASTEPLAVFARQTMGVPFPAENSVGNLQIRVLF